VTIAEPLSELILRLHGRPMPELDRAIHALCTALEDGHVCLPITEIGLSPADLQRASSVVGAPGEFKPLILDEAGRLYLHRYWRYERQLALALRARAIAPTCPFDPALLQAGLDRHFAGADAAQRAAASGFVQRPLGLITGGPGTGKTRTAAMAMVLLAEQWAAEGRHARCALAAPTGKAAARLAQSLAATLEKIDLPPATRALLPTSASTLHRLLGSRPGTTTFRHHAENPLGLDALIVDEASMVALPLMARLLAALQPSTRLLLLGDPHQLASVEAGHVLGDLCASPLRTCVTELVKNYRFSGASGIFQLSRAVNEGARERVEELLATPPPDLAAAPLPVPSALPAALRASVLEGYRPFLQAATPRAALDAFDAFRILTPLREGPYGVGYLNRLAEQVLAGAGLIEPEHAYYAGRPILILRNDATLGLFNGDIGIIRRDDDGELRAFFPDDAGGVRALAPARLPEHETAFAMTVHKSQGSEFHRVLIVLPESDSPILSRELLYTAVTRAREAVALWWSEAALTASLERRVTRWSGLVEQLGASE